ncbi:amino acid ABC transporter substrate-binding protein [Pseudomonas citronellolis]|uniref:amino acid ABC transporter substrate-binding protein n=1 Tax=Pseudomonas citronellolis TaxID=53408 RepID=UPI0023E3E78D|nr:amino acid ABC transporter substrate-binding protein [Pseudomonas citronellolis]MDF3936990.1 amino acid ABC transporter substrate-binding protein [Pseudomonas citronellolis]
MRLAATLLALALLAPVAQADTLGRIRAEHTLVLGFLPANAPFSDGDASKASGYAIDLCQAVAARLRGETGLSDLQVRYRPLPLAQALDAVRNGEVDLLCSPLVETLQRRETVSFSLPVFTAGLGVILRGDADATLRDALGGAARERTPTWRGTINQGLNKRSFAVLKGTTNVQWAQRKVRELGLQSRLVEVDSYQDGVAKVLDRQVDAFFGERLSLLNYQARAADPSALRVSDRLFEMAGVALPLARGDDDFRLLVDRALSDALRGDAGEALYTRYFGVPSAQQRLLLHLYPLP